MIISHKHKFIFLKTRKTAGTSIEISLSRYCGKNDIITPITPEDEKIREKHNVYPQNYLDNKIRFLSNIPYLKKFSMKFWNHITADQVKERIDEDIWNSYFKFCFDRNPWDKTISMYFWDKNSLGDISFDEYLKTKNGREFRNYNFPIYTHNDKVVVDFIGKFENLKDDLEKICKKVGIKFDGWLPKAKGSYRTEKKHYSHYYNDETSELIKNHFKKEIELLGYNFEMKQN